MNINVYARDLNHYTETFTKTAKDGNKYVAVRFRLRRGPDAPLRINPNDNHHYLTLWAAQNGVPTEGNSAADLAALLERAAASLQMLTQRKKPTRKAKR